jgi:hypothetical protein
MRTHSIVAAGIAAVVVAFTAISSSPANATPTSRIYRPPSRTAASRTVPADRRRSATASCSAAILGPGAFDSGIVFEATGGSTYDFGGSNLATGGYSGVFEGSGSTVCDYNSVIAGGNNDTIDSGTGNTPAGASYSFIGAGTLNSVSSPFSSIVAGSTSSVSGSEAMIGAGYSNAISGDRAFIGAGGENVARGAGGFVGAGSSNSVSAGSSAIVAGDLNSITGPDSFAGAGYGNAISGSGSFIGTGGTAAGANPGNTISGTDSFIGAGDLNTIAGTESFLGSGGSNTITSSASYASILGGNRNNVSGEYASILGGFGSTASGSYAIVAGGDQDTAAGILSFAAGYHADAAHNGSFVWSDYGSGSATLKDTAVNQFVARASGGVYFYSNEAATAGVKLGAGSGTWASLSDRDAKTDVAALDDESVLAKVSALPVTTWRYKTERGVRHIGPMAQDFYAAFGVGEDDRHITSIDEDGVALAAIKAQSHQIGALRDENEMLETRLDALATEVARLRSSSRK